MALLLGGGLALATTHKQEEPNIYKDPVSGEWEDLSEYTGDYDCEDAGECTAFRNSMGQITHVNPGTFTPK